MSPFLKLVTLVLVILASEYADAYSRGAPEEACLTMEPEHGPSTQITPAPFSVTPQQNSIEKGGTVKVTIEAKSPRGSFQGFLFVAVNPNDSPQPLGRFMNSPRPARSIDCRPGLSNALTHRDAKGKDKLEFTWVAPPDFEGEIEFRCTFLRDFTTFWVQVPSSTRVQVGQPASNEKSSSGKISSSLVPLVTVLDYFIWRVWFWAPNANINP
ncbi:putative defense protein 3 [Daphnia carinata]|uniref:putative defense protein 3 n=1 Tax=Daphnia carinata TaxID=120202 RepID=UPI00257AE6B3|nr:putative defense protein 3 [Daphnia carinata]